MEKWYGNIGLFLFGEVFVYLEMWNFVEGFMVVVFESFDLYGFCLIFLFVIVMDCFVV